MLFLSGSVLALLVVSCDDTPTRPKPTEPKSYPFYFNDPTHQTYIYRYDPVADSLDTLLLPMALYGSLAVSHDGTKLLIGTSTQTGVFDIAAESLLTLLPYSSHFGIAASPDGHLLALGGFDLTVLSAADYSIVYQDTAYHWRPSFSPDSKTLLTKVDDGDSKAHILEFGPAGVVSRYKQFFTHLSHLVASADHLWAAYLLRRDVFFPKSFVQLYDPLGDSVVYTDSIIPGQGDLVFAPDGQTLIYSSPGDRGSSAPGDTIYFLQTEMPFARDQLITAGLVDQRDSVHAYFGIRPLAISPDGKFLAGVARPSNGKVAIFALPSRQPVACFDFNLPPDGAIVSDVACQTTN